MKELSNIPIEKLNIVKIKIYVKCFFIGHSEIFNLRTLVFSSGSLTIDFFSNYTAHKMIKTDKRFAIRFQRITTRQDKCKYRQIH